MNAREFLALSDQLAAFQAAMSGSLKQETQDAKDALAALGTAKDISTAQSQLASDVSTFEEYKTATEVTLVEREAAAQSKEDALTQISSDLAASKTQLTGEQEAFALEQKQYADAKVATELSLATSQAALADAQAKLEADQAALVLAQGIVADRERALADTLKQLAKVKV